MRIAKTDKIALIQDKVREIMRILGLDLEHPDMIDTPKRIAKMYVNELFSGLRSKMPKCTAFPNTEKYDEMVIVKDIEFYSMCSHHWMPFFGKIHIGYVPSKHYVGISKMARVAEHFACMPQVQERLSTQIAEFLYKKLKPHGLIVVIEATHLCMSARGVKKPSAKTLTSCIKGQIDKEEFFKLIKQ